MCLTALLLCFGCVTPHESFVLPDAAPPNDLNGNLASNGAASQELTNAQRLIRAGDYSTAIPRLMKIVQIHPTSPSAVDARYFLGVTFYKIGGARESSAYFTKYLDLAPEGRYAGLSRDYLKGLASSGPYAEKIERAERIEALESMQEVAVLPEKLELANLYWESGDYTKAGEIYSELVKTWPRLENDRVIRTRLERQPDGALVVLTPAEVERRYADEEPIVIYNTSSYRSGRYSGFQRNLVNTEYNVTGEVLNRSNDDMRSVEVVVTIYGLGQRIFETKTIQLGPLRAGESFPFSTTFTQFDNIENVQRFECRAIYYR